MLISAFWERSTVSRRGIPSSIAVSTSISKCSRAGVRSTISWSVNIETKSSSLSLMWLLWSIRYPIALTSKFSECWGNSRSISRQDCNNGLWQSVKTLSGQRRIRLALSLGLEAEIESREQQQSELDMVQGCNNNVLVSGLACVEEFLFLMSITWRLQGR